MSSETKLLNKLILKKMNGKEFIKKEPILFKICYVIGAILFLLNLNEVTNENSEVHAIFPIIAFIIIALFFVRMALFINKN